MLNILLAVAIVLAAFAWRRTGFWLPRFAPLALSARRRMLVLGGWLIVVVAVGYSAGDIIGGRTQVSKDPVQYATRLIGAEAHHHDLQNALRFWQQVLLQCGVGVMVGAALITASGLRRSVRPVTA